MFVRLLGPIGAGADPEAVTAAPGSTAAGVLAVLAAEGGRVVSVDAVIDAVWDDPPMSARNAVQVAVSRLRRAYGNDVVATAGGGYRLSSALARVDVLEVSHLVQQARRHAADRRPGESLSAASTALALDVGEPLAGLHTRWAEAVRQAAAEQLAAASVLRADALVALARAGEAVDEIRALAARRPLDEPAALALISALAADGRGAEALAEYDRFRRFLADQLGTDPSPRAAAVLETLLHPEPTTASTPSAPVHAVRLPVLAGPTWGRSKVVADLCDQVAQGHRIVTVVGPGGIGKTRVAVAAGWYVAGEGGRSVTFVDLTACRAAPDITAALDAVVDPTGSDHAAVLATDSHLLVLDNAEHLLEHVPAAVESLLSAGDVCVLVTSRSPLRMKDEKVTWLAELDAVGADAPAVRMLADRASAWLAPDDSPSNWFEQLAAQVDGVPLALELLASALQWMTPRELTERIEVELTTHQTVAASPERHLSVTAAISWSIERAGDEQRRGLGALLVARGSFDLTAAAALLAAAVPDRPARALVAELVDLSLVQRVASPGEIRLRVLEPIRLAAAGHPLVPVAGPEVSDAHARYYLDVVHRAFETRDHGVEDILAAVHRNDDANVSAGLAWAWEHDPEIAYEHLADLMYYWYYVCRNDDLQRWDFASGPTSPLSATQRARCAVALMCFHVLIGDAERAAQFRPTIEPHISGLNLQWTKAWTFAETERLRLAGDLAGSAALWATYPGELSSDRRRRALGAGSLALREGRVEEAAVLLDEALAMGSADDRHSDVVYVLNARAYAALILGDLDTAEHVLKRASVLAQVTAIRDDFVLTSGNVAWLELGRRRPGRAVDTIAASVRALGRSDDELFFSECCIISAIAAHQLGLDDLAAALMGGFRRVYEKNANLVDWWAVEQYMELTRAVPASPAQAATVDTLGPLVERLSVAARDVVGTGA